MGDVIHKFIAVGAVVLMTVVLIAAVTKLNNQSQESMNIGSSKLSKLNSDSIQECMTESPLVVPKFSM